MEIIKISEREYLKATSSKPIKEFRKFSILPTKHKIFYISWFSDTSHLEIFSLADSPILHDHYLILTSELDIKILDITSLEVLCEMGLPDIYQEYVIKGNKVIVTTLDGSKYEGEIKNTSINLLG
jgi:hypothetical protein